MNSSMYLADKYSGKTALSLFASFFRFQNAPPPFIPNAVAKLLSEKILVPSSKTAKNYYGVCFFCKQYDEVTFRCAKTVIDEETGEKTKGKRFMICLRCLR